MAAVDKDASDEDIMVALGLLEESEEIRGEGGERYYRFTFSPNIFPPYVQQEWDAYMDVVGQFEVASQRLKEGVLSQAEFSGVDLIRKKAHNTVSQSIGDILDFDGWELEDYRRFAAKMRDKQAAKSMGELARYADGFKEFYDEHLSTMSKKIRNHR